MTTSKPVVAEATYAAEASEVWDAITNPQRMRKWYFQPIEDFRAEVGFETEFDIECEGNVYSHLWKVTEVVPEKLLVYDWRYRGYPGESQLAWELEPTDAGTHLTIRHSGIETFPQDNSVFSRDSTQAGWNYFAESLGKHLEQT